MHSNDLKALVVEKLLFMLCINHVLERRQYEALYSVTSVGDIECDHHANLMSKVSHIVDQYVTTWDVQEKLKVYKIFIKHDKFSYDSGD